MDWPGEIMKKSRTFFAFVFFAFAIVCLNGEAKAQKFGKDDLIKAARFLEERPFDKNADLIRALAVTYVMETDDVTVTVCGGKATEPLLDKKNKNSSVLVSQYTIGMAAFKLQNPQNTNEADAQKAGIESALKAYEAMIAEKPKTRHPGMDELVAKRNSGDLQAFVSANGCKDK